MMFKEHDWEDGSADVCAYCDEDAEFECDNCGEGVCIDHSKPWAPQTIYCPKCYDKVK